MSDLLTGTTAVIDGGGGVGSARTLAWGPARHGGQDGPRATAFLAAGRAAGINPSTTDVTSGLVLR